jgi:hypothetical protein
MDSHVTAWNAHRVHGALAVAMHPAWRDRAWCTVDALSTALGIHRITAYLYMKAFGRRHGKGASMTCVHRAYERAAEDHGFRMVMLDKRKATLDYGRTITSAQKKIMPHERIVLDVRGHVIGFSNGQTNDWAAGRGFHVQSALKFVKAA